MNRHSPHIFAAALLSLLVAAASQAEPDSFVRATSTPPPGFEDLAGPQTTQVDVFFAGRRIVSALARYDLTSIEFLDPAEVTAAIPRLLDPATVRAALSGPLPSNAQLRCSHKAQTDCGELDPDIAGVIFDDGRFALELFVNPLQLEAKTLVVNRYLPPSSAPELSTIHLVSVSLSDGGEGSAFNLGNTSLFAKGESRVHSRFDIGDEGFAVNELSWQRDRNGWEYEAGLYRSVGRSVAFLNEQDITGVRVARSFKTRADLDSAEGTPIFLFLNQRSRVDILRDGRLLDSRFYEGGNQQLDTTRLPDGAYRIELRIEGTDGRERNEEFFYVRTARLPPLDTPLYFAEAGVVSLTGQSALPEVGSAPWLRAGTARRLANDLGVEATVLHAGATSLVEGGVFWFGPGWQLRAGALASADSDTGFALSTQLRRDGFALSLDYRQLSAGQSIADPLSTAAATLDGDFDLINEGFTQSTFTMTLPAFDGRLALRAQSDRRGDTNTVNGFGISYTRPVYRAGPLVVDLDFDASKLADDSLVRLGVEARWRNDRRYTVVRPAFSARADANGSQSNVLLNASTTARSSTPKLGHVTDTFFAFRDADRSAFGTSVMSDSRLGRSSVELQYVDAPEGSHLGYSANSRFSLATQGKAVAFGGERADLAALVVDIAEVDTEAPFQVLIDDQEAGVALPGKRTVIGLRPYETYEVRLRPTGTTLVEFDDRPRQVTLYPGNVRTERFEPRTVTVLVGQALAPGGEPLARARFDNVDGYGSTDQSGWFQVEVTHREPLILTKRDGERCVLRVGPVTAEDGLAVLEPLTCEPIAE